MKEMILIFICLLFASVSFAGQQTEKSMDEMWGREASLNQSVPSAKSDWFKKTKYSMFIHWGLYSIPGGQWKEKNYYGISEWLMSGRMAGITKEEYQKLATKFNPKAFDAKEWVQLAVDSGMKNIVITAKHHEGFAMYNSNQSDFDIEDATPFKRDPLKELALACKEAGIGFGFYYSQYQDWHEQGSADVSWSNKKQKNNFDRYFNEKVIPQVTELLTQYGPVSVIWFDTPGDMSKEHSIKLVKLVRELQPDTLINSRIGNGEGDYTTLGDHSISLVNHDGLWETIDTTNDSWAYAWYDKNWKSSTEIAQRLITTVARGGNYMLNVGPTGDGVIPKFAAGNLRKVGEWLSQYGDTIYDVKASPWGRMQSWGDVTIKGNKMYLHIFNWPSDQKIFLNGLINKIRSASLVNYSGNSIKVIPSKDDWITLILPCKKPKSLIPVIELDLIGNPAVKKEIGIVPNFPSVLNASFATCMGCQNKEVSWMEKFGEWKYANNLLDWNDEGQAIWSIDVATEGQYLVEVEYSADDTVDYSEWSIKLGNEQLAMQALDTGERINSKRQFKGKSLLRYRKERLGIVNLIAGKQKVLITPMSKVINGGIKLKAVHLTRITN